MSRSPQPERGPESFSSPAPVSPSPLAIDGLAYSLDAAPRPDARSVVTVTIEGDSKAARLRFTDRVDLYGVPGRTRFARAAGRALARTADAIEGHLRVLLDQAERESEEAGQAAPVVKLDALRLEAAERLLRVPGLLEHAARAFDALGFVGEERCKRLVFLVAVSRLLMRPLSGVLTAPSGAGKTLLLERLTALLPAECVEFFSRVTKNALFYAGSDRLSHKVVIVDEIDGASDADYAFRTLQTSGTLKLAAPVNGRTETIEAKGPIALLFGTTRTDLNPENVSRCLELPLDDGPEQTRRIHAAQRRASAGEVAPSPDVQVWHDIQRVLEPLEVVIPFAESLAFPSRGTRDRREQPKLLSLVMAHTLLCQRQRERDEQGRLIATREDYRVAFDLFQPLVEASVDGLSAPGANLYQALAPLRGSTFTRNDVTARTGISYSSVMRGLEDLVKRELVTEFYHGCPSKYRLVEGANLGERTALTKPDEIPEL